MYIYAEDKIFLKKSQAYAVDYMLELEKKLRKRGLNTQMILIGNGARNMITQNDYDVVEFDFNLNVLHAENLEDGKAIHDLVDRIMNNMNKLRELQETKEFNSALKINRIFLGPREKGKFAIEVSIIRCDEDGNWLRLERENNTDTYSWKQLHNSKNYIEVASKIKNSINWETVRNEYLDIKNDHYYDREKISSLECYIEALNNVYNNLKEEDK